MTNPDKILSTLKKNPPRDGNNEIMVTQYNNISQFGNIFLSKGKNSDMTRHNPKTQTNKQQKDITRSALVILR